MESSLTVRVDSSSSSTVAPAISNSLATAQRRFAVGATHAAVTACAAVAATPPPPPPPPSAITSAAGKGGGAGIARVTSAANRSLASCEGSARLTCERNEGGQMESEGQ